MVGAVDWLVVYLCLYLFMVFHCCDVASVFYTYGLCFVFAVNTCVLCDFLFTLISLIRYMMRIFVNFIEVILGVPLQDSPMMFRLVVGDLRYMFCSLSLFSDLFVRLMFNSHKSVSFISPDM